MPPSFLTRRSSDLRERGRTARQRGALPEELDLDPATAEVAVAQERQRVVLLEGAARSGAGRGPEGHDVEAERSAQAGEPLEELGRFELLHHHGDRHALDLGEPEPAPPPPAEVGHRHYRPVADCQGRVDVLVATVGEVRVAASDAGSWDPDPPAGEACL